VKVAVTGARGRVAPVVISALEAAGACVVPCSRTPGGAVRGLGEFDGDVDVVVHCAWSRVPMDAETDPGHAEREDLPLLRRILEATPARLVFLSTGAVYGDTGSRAALEEDPVRPLGAYARGKLAAEALLASCAPERSLVLRTTNVLLGTRDSTRPQGVLPRMVSAARGGPVFDLWGDGSTTKDYIHCSDFTAALLRLVDIGATGTFNVGSGSSLSLRDMLAIVGRLAEAPVPVRVRPHFDWDVTVSHVAIEKLRAVTGWAPAMSATGAVECCTEELL
jgi:UDP-glucose 4-epimerase